MERHPVCAAALNRSCSHSPSGQRLNTTIRSAGMLQPSGLIYRWTGVGGWGGGEGRGGSFRNSSKCSTLRFTSGCFSGGLIRTKTHVLYYGTNCDRWASCCHVWQHVSTLTVTSTPPAANENGFMARSSERRFACFTLRQESVLKRLTQKSWSSELRPEFE